MPTLNSIADIPQGWRNILTSVQAVCPSAVLAGGCLRDLDNDREVKDLDIFITAGGLSEAEWAIRQLRKGGCTVTYDETCGSAYPEDQNLEVVLVANLDTEGYRLPAQLIFVNWPTASIIDRFDYGICRLSFDGEQIIRGPQYAEDRESRVFRLCRDRPTPVSMRGSIHRYARLSRKYEGWTWWPYEAPGEDAFLLFN